MRNRVLALVVVAALLVGVRVAMGGLESDNSVGKDAQSSVATSTSSTPNSKSPGDNTLADGPEDPDGLWFQEESEQIALARAGQGASREEFGTMSGGVAAADYDQDGLVDLFFSRSGQPNQLFRARSDGTFRDVSEQAGVDAAPERPGDGSAAVGWGDIDGDGDLDLFVGGFGLQPDQLFVNQGDGTFVERAEDLGLRGVTPADLPHATAGVAFADWDRDGDLDFVTADWVSPDYASVAELVGAEKPEMCELNPVSVLRDRSRAATTTLWQNDGTGRFSDATQQMGLEVADVAGFTPMFADLDDDGWLDLLITGDFCTSRLYQNAGGTKFVDQTEEGSVDTAENAMGSVVEDLDGDGRLDWFVTSISGGPDNVGCLQQLALVGCSGNRLFHGLDGFAFADATDEWDVRESGWGWGALAEDLDNNGHRELLTVEGQDFGAPEGADPAASRGQGPQAEALEYFASGSVRLWRGGSEHPLEEVAGSAGLDRAGLLKAVVAFDHDDDGDLDLVVTDTGSAPRFYRNETPRQGHWLQLTLSDETTPNTHAIGARVRVPNGAGEPGWVGEVRAGGGYQSSGPGTLQVGLGERTDVTSVEVRWPDADEFEAYPVAAIDRTLEIVREPAGQT